MDRSTTWKNKRSEKDVVYVQTYIFNIVLLSIFVCVLVDLQPKKKEKTKKNHKNIKKIQQEGNMFV